MRAMFERISLACAVASVPLMVAAQTPSTEEAPATEPAQTEQPAEGAAEQTAPPPTEEPAPETTEAETAPAAEEAVEPQPVEGQITMQSEDSILAEDLIGQTVYSTAEESIGDIANIIIKLDGTVEGVVIGVGGFLGIGEKEVAIEMSKIEFVTEEGGVTSLLLNATREDLEAAPAFKTAREQRREAENEEMQQNMGTGVAPAAPADGGAAPAAPADN